MSSMLTILGSGTCVPSLTRNSCSFLLQTGGQNLLFDCGSGVMRRLLEIGVTIYDISHIFISHFHPDHIGELASFFFALKYSPQPDPRQPLTIVAGQGFRSYFERLKGVYGDWIVLPADHFAVVELDNTQPDRCTFDTFTVTSMPISHNPESIAYRVMDANGKSLVYSGDTDVCDELAEIAAGADIMICEAAFPDNRKTTGHLTPSLAGKIAQKAKVKQLVLTHFYPECEVVDIEKQCQSTYNGKVLLAHDLMTMSL